MEWMSCLKLRKPEPAKQMLWWISNGSNAILMPNHSVCKAHYESKIRCWNAWWLSVDVILCWILIRVWHFWWCAPQTLVIDILNFVYKMLNIFKIFGIFRGFDDIETVHVIITLKWVGFRIKFVTTLRIPKCQLEDETCHWTLNHRKVVKDITSLLCSSSSICLRWKSIKSLTNRMNALTAFAFYQTVLWSFNWNIDHFHLKI